LKNREINMGSGSDGCAKLWGTAFPDGGGMSEERHGGRSEPLLRAVRFGAFELDVRAAELRKHGVRIRLQEQPFQVLLMLLEQPGEVVLREQIRKKLWPNDTIVEFAPSINAAIQRLRDALGDSADQPRYVETVARRGYRFIGELLREEPVLEPPQPPVREDIADASDLTGHAISHYRVYEKLGRGGMGEVYRARDTKLGRDVALKVLPDEFAQDADRMGRFEREAQVLAALNHPNIAQIYGVQESGGVRALVMELVPGESLKGPLPLETALGYAKQIADALEAAHDKGIVHRDLKPANIMITPDGVVKVLDFGLATVTPGAMPALDQNSSSQAGAVLGTAAYMAPEQARGQPVNKRADIWAFGVVLFEMLTGRQAFRGDTTTDVLAAVVTEEPDLTRVPATVRRLLQCCLQKDPKQRLQAIGDWRLLLEDAPRAARRDGRTIALVATGVCVLLAVAFVAGRWTSRTPSPAFQRVTFRRGFVDGGRFANGGRTIAYSASWDGNPYRVYSTQAENPESRDLGIANAHLLGVSPSGELALALTPDRNVYTTGTLARAPISGGTPREVADDIAAADWTSDGKRLAVVRARSGFEQLEFPIGNVLYQTTGGIYNPRISPKGDWIAFLDLPFGGSLVGSLATVDMKGNKKTLTEFWLGEITGLAWSSSSDEILFTAAAFGLTTSLYAVNRSGRQRLIAHLSGNFTVLDVAPDGRVLMDRLSSSYSLVYLPTSDSKETDLYWHDFSLLSDISRDGKSLLFAEGGDATRSGEDYVAYLRGTDGSTAVRLGPGLPLELSPDGRWAMVLGSTRAPSQLVLLPTGTGEARPLTRDGIHHQGAGWTPDGKRIVFVGNEPGHRIRYYVHGLDGGQPRAITPENVAYTTLDPVAISPDGKSVAVAGLDGKIVLYPLDDGAPRPVPKLANGFAPLRWCPGNSLMVYHAGGVPLKIFRVDIETGEQTLWRELAPASRTGFGGIPSVRVGADCRTVAYTAQYLPSELWIVSGLR
jgi:eukaryotic-like serine/threonine-protein kinase